MAEEALFINDYLPTPDFGSQTPVIIDTDPGDDIDDTWALVQALNSLDMDIKLITTAVGDTAKRAQLVAKLLEVAGKTHIPIGIGEVTKGKKMPTTQFDWVEDWDQSQYPGEIRSNAADAIVDVINNQYKEGNPVTLVCIAPLINIQAALALDPQIQTKVKRVVFMGGDIQKKKVEYNISEGVKAAQAVFKASWELVMAPLDATMKLQLDSTKFGVLKQLSPVLPLLSALFENNTLWGKGSMMARMLKTTPTDKEMSMSSLLHDCLAVYLATKEEHIDLQDMKLEVDDQGHTLVSPTGRSVLVAIGYTNLESFFSYLVETLAAH